MIPQLKIWRNSKNIKLEKGLQQGGINSAFLFIKQANPLTVRSRECEQEEKDRAKVCTWADDISVIANNRITASKVIWNQKKLSQEIRMPFSKKKAQLVILYPKNYKGKKMRIGSYLEGIEVQRKVKILGLTWEQPRYYEIGGKRTYWF